MKLDPKTGRPAEYQLFTMVIYSGVGAANRYHLGHRYRKDRVYQYVDYIEVFSDDFYVVAEHEHLPGRFVENIHGHHDSWCHVPSWKGTYEVPKCICTRQPEG